MKMFQMTLETEALIDRALAEDLSIGDPTTDILIPADMSGSASFLAKEAGILAGLDMALAVFQRFDSSLVAESYVEDGQSLSNGDLIAKVSGRMNPLLKVERTALNFIRRMSGIASETAAYVREVEGYEVRIVDTRKTTPGLRALEKYAVRVGGGYNHRQNLGDGILIKDNHINALKDAGMTLGDVVRKANSEKSHTINVEVEVEDLSQVEEALDAGAKILLLDNMGPEDMAVAVRMAEGKAVTEASGNITLRTVRAAAASGVDLISVGALTHSAKDLDISLNFTS